MYESLLQEVNEVYQDRAFLTLGEVAKFLNCSEKVIYNWNKRSDPQKRPPRLMVGKSIRFPKKDFVRWLAAELVSGGEKL